MSKVRVGEVRCRSVGRYCGLERLGGGGRCMGGGLAPFSPRRRHGLGASLLTRGEPSTRSSPERLPRGGGRAETPPFGRRILDTSPMHPSFPSSPFRCFWGEIDAGETQGVIVPTADPTLIGRGPFRSGPFGLGRWTPKPSPRTIDFFFAPARLSPPSTLSVIPSPPASNLLGFSKLRVPALLP